MSIINITPNSFSDGGLFLEKNNALNHIKKSIQEGANIIDIGAESTAPHNEPISLETEWERLKNILPQIFQNIQTHNQTNITNTIKISLDSYKIETWKKFIHCAEKYNFDINNIIINDVSGLSFLEENKCTKKIYFIKKYSEKFPKFTVCIMFSKKNISDNITLTCQNIIPNILQFFTTIIKIFKKHHISPQHIILDPGMGGFLSKDADVSLYLLENLQILKKFATNNTISNLLIGTSRKKFLAHYTKTKIHPDLSIASSLEAINNGANIIRIHDTLLLKNAFNNINT